MGSGSRKSRKPTSPSRLAAQLPHSTPSAVSQRAIFPWLARPATSFSMSQRTIKDPKLALTKFTCRAPERSSTCRAYLATIMA